MATYITTSRVSIKEQNQIQIKIYPNPSNGFINISTPIPTKETLTRFNSKGKLILNDVFFLKQQELILIHFPQEFTL